MVNTIYFSGSQISIFQTSFEPFPTLKYDSMGYPLNLKELRRTTIIQVDTGRIYKFMHGLWVNVKK